MATKSSRNAAAANLQRLLNSNTFHATTPSAGEVATAASKSEKTAGKAAPSSSDEKRIEYIPLDLLLDNPYQPRKAITVDEDLQEMAEGIKTYDLLGAYPARKHPEKEGYFQLGFGHRRREAARLAGKATMPIVVESLDNAAMAGLAAVENIHRKDLTDLELGRLFLSMQNEGYTQVEIAESIKKKRGYVVNRLRLAEAPEDIQSFVERKPDSLRAVAYLINIDDEQDRALIMDRLAAGTLTADDLAGDIQDLLHLLKEENHSPEEQQPDESSQIEDRVDHIAVAPTEDASYILVEGTQDEAQEHALSEQEDREIPLNSSDQQDKATQTIEATRIGSAKLRAILRSYKAYLSNIEQRKTISRREQQLVREIGEVHTLILAHSANASDSPQD